MTTKTNTTKIAKTKTTKRATKAKAKAPVNAKATGKTFTTVDLATEHNMNPKSLRARIRRNLDKWKPLFAGERHVFKDNATTRKAIVALLEAK